MCNYVEILLCACADAGLKGQSWWPGKMSTIDHSDGRNLQGFPLNLNILFISHDVKTGFFKYIKKTQKQGHQTKWSLLVYSKLKSRLKVAFFYPFCWKLTAFSGQIPSYMVIYDIILLIIHKNVMIFWKLTFQTWVIAKKKKLPEFDESRWFWPPSEPAKPLKHRTKMLTLLHN